MSAGEREAAHARQSGLFGDAPGGSPGEALPQAPQHPRANRELALGTLRLRYELRRAQRRSIGFTVGAEGLSVSAPRWVTQAEIEAALHAKGAWILRKLAEQAERRQQQARIEWRDGAALPFLGAPLVLRLVPERGLRLDGPAPAGAADGTPAVLRVGLPADAEPARIAVAVLRWLQREARTLFEARLAHFAPRLGVRCTRLALSSARTRWGSASADGSIRLNWRLVHFPLELVDYVVVHELAHLHEMNHGPRFWAHVAAVMPDYLRRRAALKASQAPLLPAG
ncbi:M48 family metallopeptidase [Caldimonas tepidiphila]|uniref:M48 family metallopeptidase n=1 Tax=Caldimonas tepidiphila TaxID=2315841 RepID=UPI001F0B8E39|nr:SprT family zinc-dependent metalloprotease [Caldimonas tepidiphila]